MDEKIRNLLTRGVETILPDKENLEKRLVSGEKLNVYMGIDPTFPKIHLGHAILLRKLQAFSDAGHAVTFLIGDFTAMIGDTSDKESERPALSETEIKTNVQTYQAQASKFVHFENVKLRYNSEWLEGLSLADELKLLPNFSLGEFVGRELIKKRMNEGKRVGLQELLYPFLQGYDSYMLDTDIQLGGTDQIFNMQAGRTLIRKLRNKESFVLTTRILLGTDGRKMSKSWGNAIWIDDEPDQMYGKIMSLSDENIYHYFELATDVSTSELSQIAEELKNGQNPMSIKKKLAYIIVSQIHGEESAHRASDTFQKTVQEKQVPESMIEIRTKENIRVLDVAMTLQENTTASEIKRAITQGGFEIDGQKFTNPFETIQVTEGSVAKFGKRNFGRIKIIE